MKILHVSPSFARRDGGPSEVLRRLLPALQKRGCAVELVTTDKGLEAGEDTPIDSVSFSRSYPPDRLTFAPGMHLRLHRALSEADVVHVHGFYTYPTTAALHAARKQLNRVVLQPHGSFDKYHRAKNNALKNIYGSMLDHRRVIHCAALVGSSTREVDDLLSAWPTAIVRNIPLPVDDLLFEVRRLPTRTPPRILFLGRIAAKKRLDLVLRATASRPLSSIRAELVVAGPIGSDLDYDPRDLAHELQIADRVRFFGVADAEQRRQLLESASVFVLPSEDESFGMAVAEAMAAGCPVVATADVGLVPDALRDSAIVACSRDVDSIATSILEALDRAEELGDAARRYASMRFSTEAVAGRFITEYARIVE